MQRNQHSIEIQSLWERPKSTLSLAASTLEPSGNWFSNKTLALVAAAESTSKWSFEEKRLGAGFSGRNFRSFCFSVHWRCFMCGSWSLLIKKLAWQYVNICVALFRRIIFAELSSSWGERWIEFQCVLAPANTFRWNNSSQQPQTA